MVHNQCNQYLAELRYISGNMRSAIGQAVPLQRVVQQSCCLQHHTGVEQRSRAFQLTPSVALLLSVSPPDVQPPSCSCNTRRSCEGTACRHPLAPRASEQNPMRVLAGSGHKRNEADNACWVSRMPAPAGYVPEALEALTAPHIDSFDYFLSDGLRLVVQGLAPIEVSNVCSPVPPHPSLAYCYNWRLAG